MPRFTTAQNSVFVKRTSTRRGLSQSSADDNRSTAGAQPIADVLVEPIDVPSLLHYSVNASEREVNTLRGVVDGLVAATPRLHAQAEAVRARTRIAVRVQRAWRRRRRVYEAA
jgi:hypothetical protein